MTYRNSNINPIVGGSAYEIPGIMKNFQGQINYIFITAEGNPHRIKQPLTIEDLADYPETDREIIRSKLSDDCKIIVIACRTAKDYETDDTFAERFADFVARPVYAFKTGAVVTTLWEGDYSSPENLHYAYFGDVIEVYNN